jgi:hypothetical protein
MQHKQTVKLQENSLLRQTSEGDVGASHRESSTTQSVLTMAAPMPIGSHAA